MSIMEDPFPVRQYFLSSSSKSTSGSRFEVIEPSAVLHVAMLAGSTPAV